MPEKVAGEFSKNCCVSIVLNTQEENLSVLNGSNSSLQNFDNCSSYFIEAFIFYYRREICSELLGDIVNIFWELANSPVKNRLRTNRNLFIVAGNLGIPFVGIMLQAWWTFNVRDNLELHLQKCTIWPIWGFGIQLREFFVVTKLYWKVHNFINNINYSFLVRIYYTNKHTQTDY